jgi:LPXTG-motif cell wall-anchored protein
MKQRVRILLQLAVVFALILSLAPLQAIAQESMSDKADLIETAIAAGDFTVLVDLVEAAGLTETLQGEGPFTVFAPTDAAFAAVPADVLDALAADPAALQSVLLYHVVPGRLVAALISDGKEVATAEGSNVVFSFADGVKKVNGATIVARDIQASNGVIHVIDSVILPPELAATLGVGAEAAAEATPAATEEAAAEATPVATEEAAAEATPAATEEATAEAAMTEAPAPESLPVTGGESNLAGMLIAVMVLIAVAGVAVSARRRLA